MAGSKNKKKIPKQNEIPNDRQIKQGGNPCAFYDMNPSWRFHKSDPQEWSVDKENLGDIFWDEILPAEALNCSVEDIVNCFKEPQKSFSARM